MITFGSAKIEVVMDNLSAKEYRRDLTGAGYCFTATAYNKTHTLFYIYCMVDPLNRTVRPA